MARFEPVARILTVLKAGTRSKHRLWRETGAVVSAPSQLDKHLHFLIKHGYVEMVEEEGRRKYRITQKGFALASVLPEAEVE